MHTPPGIAEAGGALKLKQAVQKASRMHQLDILCFRPNPARILKPTSRAAFAGRTS